MTGYIKLTDKEVPCSLIRYNAKTVVVRIYSGKIVKKPISSYRIKE